MSSDSRKSLLAYYYTQDSVFVKFGTFTDCSKNTDEIKQAFDDLYNALSDKTLKEKDAIIDLTCNLCRLHQQSGFTDGIRLGLRLSQELNTP